MEGMTTNYRNGSLPKLVTLKEHQRRDSLSSSRTRDSGYNSEPEISFSPLDFTDPEQYMFAPPSSVPSTSVNRNPCVLKIHKPLQEPSVPRYNITSSPATTKIIAKDESNCPKRPTTSSPDISLYTAPSHHPNSNLELPDQGIEQWIKDNLPAYDRTKERVSSITSLSSASSCEMYTSTDMSDDEQDNNCLITQTVLPRSALRTIEVIMRKVEVNLRYAAYTQCNGGRQSVSSGNNTIASSQNNRRASQSGTKRKIRSENDRPPNDDDEEDGQNKRRRGSLATIESSDTGAKFACPFYKHEPNRYRNRRSCPGPGWPTVHRMKEHLYRAHSRQIYCPRCYTMFEADIELSNHLRSQQCQLSAPQPLEGIDQQTLKAIRKRSPPQRPEDDKWRDVYSLLFPNVAAEDIPSPYYDSDPSTEESRRFRRELLRRVQAELVTTAGQIAGPVEQQLLRQVASIIRRCEHDILTSFDTSSFPVPPLYDRRPSDTSTRSTSSMPPVSQPGTPAPVPHGSPQHSLFPPSQGNSFSGVVPEQPQLVRRVPEQPAQFAPVQGGMGWIDWESCFHPNPSSTVCIDGFEGFTMPLWS